MICSTIFLPFPSPPFPTLSYLPGLGFLRGKKKIWRESSVLENRAQERKATTGFCWVVLSWQKAWSRFQGFARHPRQCHWEAAGPEGGTAQGLHEPQPSWTFAVCSGQGLAALRKILGLLCPSDLQPWLLIRVVDGDFSRKNLEQLKGDWFGVGDGGDAVIPAESAQKNPSG